MKDKPSAIHHYLKDWKKLSVYFDQREENEVYDYFLSSQGFKEPSQLP